MKKLLLSMRVTEAQNYIEQRNSIAYDYIDFFESLGFIIYLVPNNTKNLEKYFNDKIDLVVLSGGNNVNPELYSSKSRMDDVYKVRDETEKNLVDLSLKNNIPLFGICRGFHFLNVYFKGKLSHNIPNHVNKEHTLNSDLSLLDKQSANSFHNHGIKTNDLSKELEVLAIGEDETVEVFISRERKVLAVQWHPERQSKIYDKQLIINFLEGKI